MPLGMGVGYWRERAEEARLEADAIHDPDARKALLEIAENYDQLAQQAERMRLADFPQSGDH